MKTRDFLRLKESRSTAFMKEVVTLQHRDRLGWSVFMALGSPLAETEEAEFLRTVSHNGDASLLHLCAHGFKDPSTGGRVKRPVMVFCSHEMPNTTLQCPGPAKHPVHIPLKEVRGHGSPVNAFWTEGLVPANGTRCPELPLLAESNQL